MPWLDVREAAFLHRGPNKPTRGALVGRGRWTDSPPWGTLLEGRNSRRFAKRVPNGGRQALPDRQEESCLREHPTSWPKKP
jgi:hypothetical protein